MTPVQRICCQGFSLVPPGFRHLHYIISLIFSFRCSTSCEFSNFNKLNVATVVDGKTRAYDACL